MRTLTRLAGLGVASLLLAACGGGSDDASEGASGDPSGTASDAAPSTASSPDTSGSCDYVADGQQPARAVEPPAPEPTVSGEIPALITTNAGRIGVVLDADAAPCTVNSFVSLAGQGYYDDTPCHRLTAAPATTLVLQCGDPSGTGYGGPGYTIPDEATGSETYPAGTLAMARTPAPNSGGSQFFLVYDDTQLPPDYTVFGEVEPAGLKVLRKIASRGTTDGGPDGPPAKPVTIESVTFSD